MSKITVSIYPANELYLRALAECGFIGETKEEVAHFLIMTGISKYIECGFLDKAKAQNLLAAALGKEG